MFFSMGITAAYGFNNFLPSIVQGFGFGARTTTLLLTAPPYLLAAIASLFICHTSDRRKQRGYHIMAGVAVTIIQFIIPHHRYSKLLAIQQPSSALVVSLLLTPWFLLGA
jgi:hypothetical protein